MPSGGPYLLLSAMWSESDEAEAVASYLGAVPLRVPPGYNKGQTVSFRFEVADSAAFRRTLKRLDLSELNERGDSL